MAKVSYVGINALDKTEREILKSIVLKHLVGLERVLKQATVQFHVKQYEIGGKVKYAFNARLNKGKQRFHADASDWDLRRTTNKVMKKLITAIEHGLKTGSKKDQALHHKHAEKGKGILKRLKHWVKRSS